jgi:hypothetical protein
VESTGGESENFRLFLESIYNAGMAMALVDSRVGGQEVHVSLTLDVPHVDTLGAVDYHRNWVVVVSTLGQLEVNGLDGGYRRGLQTSRCAPRRRKRSKITIIITIIILIIIIITKKEKSLRKHNTGRILESREVY